MQVILQADQRPKQNHKDVCLPAHPQKLYPMGKEFGPILNHKIIRPSIIQCRRKWSIFFVMEVYLETMMERLNAGEYRIIFRIILCILIIGLMKSGRAAWQEEEEDTRKYFSVDKQLSTLLRHGNLLREDDGAIEFWRLKRLSSELFCVLSSLVWWKVAE